jgi:glycosyltransferase involved in cell wall biosynthesis
MKIAYILPALINRGPIKVVYELIMELKDNHQISIFYLKESKEEKIEFGFGVEEKKINLFQTIEFEKFDIIHSHGVLPDLYVKFHSKKIKKAKILTTLHNVASEDFRYQYGFLKSKIMLNLWNYATSSHDKIVVLSEYAKRDYIKYWKNKNISIVHNGISTKYLLQDINDKRVLELKERYILLGCFGMISSVKGFEQVIRALAKLNNHALLIVGDGVDAQKLKKLSKDLKVDDRVYFTGFKKEILSYISLTDVVVVPSYSEGFSLVVIEAMMMKKEIIVSDIEIFDELFELHRFKLGDIDSLANVVKSVTVNQNEKNYKQFLEKFTSKLMAKNYLKLYKSLWGEKL